MRKKAFKAIFLAGILSVLGIAPAFASEQALQWENVTFKMIVPDEIDIPSPVYVMYKGAETDLFAELSADNGYESTIQALPGTYNIYQVTPTFETDIEFMTKSQITIKNDEPVFYVYLRNADGIINGELTGEEIPSDLASYGEAIAEQIEIEEQKKQEELAKLQEEVADPNKVNVPAREETVDDGSRQTKVTTVSATEDNKDNGLTGLVVIAAVIGAIGMIIVIAVLLRQSSKNKNGGKS